MLESSPKASTPSALAWVVESFPPVQTRSTRLGNYRGRATASENPVLEPSTQTANAAGVAEALVVTEGREWVQQKTFFALT